MAGAAAVVAMAAVATEVVAAVAATGVATEVGENLSNNRLVAIDANTIFQAALMPYLWVATVGGRYTAATAAAYPIRPPPSCFFQHSGTGITLLAHLRRFFVERLGRYPLDTGFSCVADTDMTSVCLFRLVHLMPFSLTASGKKGQGSWELESVCHFRDRLA